MIKGSCNTVTITGVCGCCGKVFQRSDNRISNSFQFIDEKKEESKGGYFLYHLCLSCAKDVLELLEKKTRHRSKRHS